MQSIDDVLVRILVEASQRGRQLRYERAHDTNVLSPDAQAGVNSHPRLATDVHTDAPDNAQDSSS